MRKIYSKLLLALVFIFGVLSLQAQTINATTYPFTNAAGAALEDMSTGTTTLVTANQDDGISLVTNIGFEFWYASVRQTQFTVNSNGLIRLGATGVTSSWDNSVEFANVLNAPKIAPYYDDLWTGSNGKVHSKITGTAPNRRLVIEWQNHQIPRVGSGTGAGTFQAWLYENTGVIEYVYGSGIAVNSANGGYTIGLQAGAATNFASVTAAANTVSYVTANNTQSTAIASGTKFSFTPIVPAAPSGLTFTGVTATQMTLNWTDVATNEVGYVIYRSTDGVVYSFITQLSAGAITTIQGSLSPGTTYYWKVYAVSDGALSTSLDGNQATLPPGIITSNGTGGGLWSSTTTWSTGAVPTSSDNVTILNGDAVTIDIAATTYNLTVGGGTSGTLVYEATTARTLTVNDLTIAAGGTMQSAASGTVTTHLLSLSGNLTNNGNIDFSTNGNTAGAGISFTGTNDASLTLGGGSTTDLKQTSGLTVNKGTNSTPVLSFLPGGTFTVLGANTAGMLTITNGTFKISGANSFSNPLFSVTGYSIPATGGFWMDNANATVTGQNNSPTVSGTFRISQGTFNIGTATGNSMGFNAGSTIIIEGGAVNATGRFGVAVSTNVFTYNQSGGTVTVATIGNASGTLASFDLGTSVSSVVNITAGTIITQLANTSGTPRDYRNQAGSGTVGVTGGTVQLGNAASGTAKAFTIQGVLPNLVITNTSAGHSATFGAIVTYNHITRDITINTGNTINFGNGIFLFNGTTILNNGVITHNGASSRFITFKVNTNVSYSGTGTVTAPMTSLELQNELNFTLDPAVTNIVANRIIIFTGTFVNANKLTLGNGGTATSVVQIGNTTTPTNAGTFDVAPLFNLGTGGQNIFYLRTTNTRTTGPEINPGRVLTTLTYDDNDPTHQLSVVGGNLTVSSGTTPTLNLTNGKVNLNGNILTLGLNGTTALLAGTMGAPGATSYVYNGQFKRWISTTTGAREFPIGVAAVKRNASINFTTAAAVGGTLTAEWISLPGGQNGMPLLEPAVPVVLQTTASNGYWSLVAADGLSGGAYTGTFTGTGISNIGNHTTLVLVKRNDNVSPWTLNGTHVTTTGSIAVPVLSRTGMTGFSAEFAVAGDGIINPLPITITYFRGTKQGSVHNLTWKVNCVSSPTAAMTLERKGDGGNFAPVYNITATAAQCFNPFSFDDIHPLPGMNYYRLKTVDADGKATYSAIVALLNKDKGFDIVSIAPNPTNGQFKLNVTTTAQTSMEVVITDMMGRIVTKRTVSLISGFNGIDMDVSSLANGTYHLYGNTNEGMSRTLSFVKQ